MESFGVGGTPQQSPTRNSQIRLRNSIMRLSTGSVLKVYAEDQQMTKDLVKVPANKGGSPPAKKSKAVRPMSSKNIY